MTSTQRLIDVTLAIINDRRFPLSLKIAAIDGWMQGRRKELIGECLSVDGPFPDISFLHGGEKSC